ncbi:MAG: peptidylprolyl isomerase [Candidatus Acidiferrales bacterium]
MSRIASRFVLGLAACCAFVLMPGSLAAQTQSSAAKSAAPGHARSAHSSTDPALLHPSLLKARAPAVYEVKFTTTKGDFVVRVTRAWAPLGADRFYNLVRHRFFTDAAFFRVVSGFIIQFGMSPDPRVSAAWENANIKDDPVTQHNTAGTLTFAMAGPNTRTTQIFINLGDNTSSLDGQGFAPFGQIISGMDVVQQIYAGYGDMPEMGGRGPSADLISKHGKAYLEKDFPKLDVIKAAVITSPAPAAHAAPMHHPVKAAPAAAAPPAKP